MPLNVLIAPDKFKGTLSAHAAARAMAAGWNAVRPGDHIRLLSMSDGGDGFGDVVGAALGAKVRIVKTVDAAKRSRAARWWWENKTRTAIIESAEAVGLAGLKRRYHPFQLDSFGLGKIIQNAAAKGAKRCIIGVGGSATNDGGFGVARSFGWQFLDAKKKPIVRWIHLDRLARIVAPETILKFDEILVAVDVKNILLGPQGATRIYGPQKGLRPQDFALAEKCLSRLVEIYEKDFGKNFSSAPGSGAAGGLGFGLRSFLGARLIDGFEMFSSSADLKRHLQWANIVVTGEGAIDDSTLMGKGVGRLARECRKRMLPCLGVAGVVRAKRQLKLFTATVGLTQLTDEHSARTRPAFWIKKSASKLAQHFFESVTPDKVSRSRGNS